DLGIPYSLVEIDVTKWFEENTNIKVNLFSLSGIHIGSIELDGAPTPRRLITDVLESKYQQVMEDPEHTLHEWLESYILDDGTLASTSFPNGLTELNAYNHGLVTEYRLNSELPDNNPYKGLLGQRHGVFHFLFNLKAYLYELKTKHPYK